MSVQYEGAVRGCSMSVHAAWGETPRQENEPQHFSAANGTGGHLCGASMRRWEGEGNGGAAG